MKRKELYTGIDYFKVIAAFLVVAIHTSPLTTVNETANFILTRILGRTAVPFFFMASGFFLLSEYMDRSGSDNGKLLKFLKKTTILYSIACLIYLPINIYAGYFNAEHLLPNLLKDIVFDGTFYHLWYLPGAMLGVLITYFLLRTLKTEHAFAVALGLYAIGLFGDSYYGIAAKIPFIKSFYDVFFKFSDYTRNGLFLAPVFLLLGGMIAKHSRLRLTVSVTGLTISFILLLAEGLLLRQFHVQRHDSMYIMLIPCMVFLFHTVLFWEGHGIRSLRNISMIIYLVHPLMIVLIRGLAKATGLQQLLIDNSVVHFLAVAFSSFVAAMALQLLIGRHPIKQGGCQHPQQ